MWGRLRGASSSRPVRTHTFGSLSITRRGPAEHTVLDLAGELDFAVADAAVDYMMGLPHNVVALDLAGLEFIDADGVRMLQDLALQRGDVSGIGEPCTLLNSPPHVEKAFELVERSQLTLLR